MFRFALITLCFLMPLSVQAGELTAPTIKQMQGLVVVVGKSGFQRAHIGLRLHAGDEVRTGRNGKAYIGFPDNSRVKLGVRSDFLIQEWQIEESIFSSTLRMLKGAFRYTAGALQSGLTRRQTTFKTNTAVLGVRGTDFWGRVDDNKTFFLLIEGSVQVAHPFEQPMVYDKAGYAIDIQADSISNPQALTMDEIAPLAAETDIQP
jgi:hypothetical protein